MDSESTNGGNTNGGSTGKHHFDIAHLAKLARLGLKPEETQKYSQQLENIFKFIEVLDEVNTDGVYETAQVTKINNMLRVDEAVKSPISAELIDCSPKEKIANQIAVKAIIKE